ncbi:sarcosine oxidase subunit gamma [Halomonas sp. V046]|uniref:sarcosine oxidase subunit gamma n=1 Tax=Halomonas sp. V046 TaxID=3459611 RepID=UPI0040442AEA
MSDAPNTGLANVYDAQPGDAIGVESPLAWSYANSTVPAPSAKSRVTLRERVDLDHLVLRGGAIVLDEALREVFGVGLPARPQQMLTAEDGEASMALSVQWLSPDEWLLIVPEGRAFEVETALRRALGAASAAISCVTGGQTLIELAGDEEALGELLMKSVVYDVHPRAFPPGKGVTTVFAKATVILRRPDDTRWELVVRRSFADYVYRWLLDAGEEFAIGVERGDQR